MACILCRQAVKLLQLSEAAPKHSAALCVHSSLAAAAAWRYAQLLTVLPKRETEAAQWKNCAEAYHEHARSADTHQGQLPLQELLGPLDFLRGQDSGVNGIVVDLTLRRALPYLRTEGTP